MKIAMVGAGGMGKTHIENILRIKDARITDICDTNPDAREWARSLNMAYHDDLQRMLTKTEAELVLICTPTFLHYQQVRAALMHGKHCVCEKPLCFTVEEARELYELADRQGVRLYVAHVMLFWEQYAQLTHMVRERPYGRVLDAELYRLTARPAWLRGNWLFDREKSGLLPYDLHIHDLYFLVSLFGKPKVGYVQHGGRGEESYDEYLRICYEYPGLTVCAQASWYHAPVPFTQGFRFYFENAVASYDGSKLQIYERDKPVTVIENGGEAIETDINVPPSLSYLREMEHFLDCARRGVESDRVPREQVFWTLETLEQITAGGAAAQRP